jgi:hypothetical protein
MRRNAHSKLVDTGAGIRVFAAPAGENAIAISLDMDDDEDFADMKPAATEPPPGAAESPVYRGPLTCKYCDKAPCVLVQCNDESLDDTRFVQRYSFGISSRPGSNVPHVHLTNCSY